MQHSLGFDLVIAFEKSPQADRNECATAALISRYRRDKLKNALVQKIGNHKTGLGYGSPNELQIALVVPQNQPRQAIGNKCDPSASGNNHDGQPTGANEFFGRLIVDIHLPDMRTFSGVNDFTNGFYTSRFYRTEVISVDFNANRCFF